MIEVQRPSLPPQANPTPRPRTKQHAKASSRAPKAFEFISSDSGGKPPANTRKFIRSYVMRGKNTKKRSTVYQVSGPSFQPDQEDGQPGESTPSLPPSSPPSSSSSSSPSGASTVHGQVAPALHRNSRASVLGGHGKRPHFDFPRTCPAPVRTPHDLALVELPEVFKSTTQQLLYTYFMSIKETMYPVEWCFGVDGTQSCWFQWLFVDLAYYYSCLFVASSFKDLYEAVSPAGTATPSTDLSKRLSGRTLRYLRLTIDLLQKRLGNPKEQLEDITIATVVSLAMVADIVGDVEATQAHVNGLKKIVRMRGGIKGVESNTALLAKICRVDLASCIKFGDRPEFAADDLSWKPSLARLIHAESPIVPRPAPGHLHSLIEDLDPKLRGVFQDLRAFASVADGLVASKNQLRPELFQEIMMSIQYRLLLLEQSLETQPVQEAVRLGLLAFQTSIFLQMYGTKMKYDFLSEQLAKGIHRLPEISPVLVQLKTWLAFIGSIAVLDSNEPWLVATIRRLTLNSGWIETRRLLEDVMWIGIIHDAAGKQVYDAARFCQDTIPLGL